MYRLAQVCTGRKLEFYLARGPFGLIQPEPKVHLQICYLHPTEARLILIAARIKPDQVTICPDCRVIDSCFRRYINANNPWTNYLT
jgi:hypothetical protein